MQNYVYGIDAFIILVERWVSDITDIEEQKSLTAMWIMLNGLLYPEQEALSRFGQELAQQRYGPPLLVTTIQVRLKELVSQGVSEGFLAVSMRDSVEQLIKMDLPSRLDSWTTLADQLVPRSLRFSHRGGETNSSTSTYGPQSS